MCATLSDSISHMNSISKALNTSLMNPGIGVIGNLKATAAALNVPLPSPGISAFEALQVPNMEEFKAIANHTYTDRLTTIANSINTASFSNPVIQAAVDATSISNLKSLTAASNSLSKSIANTFDPNYLKTFSKNYSQIYDNALTTMRYFSTSNNHINLQWKKLINTELSDNFINSFRDVSNASRLSVSLGLSEDDIKHMQDTINDAYSNDDESVEYDNSFKEVTTTNHLHDKQDDTHTLSDTNKVSQAVFLQFVVSLLIVLLSTGFLIDGTVREKPNEVLISALLDKAQTIVDITEKESKNNQGENNG